MMATSGQTPSEVAKAMRSISGHIRNNKQTGEAKVRAGIKMMMAM